MESRSISSFDDEIYDYKEQAFLVFDEVGDVLVYDKDEHRFSFKTLLDISENRPAYVLRQDIPNEDVIRRFLGAFGMGDKKFTFLPIEEITKEHKTTIIWK